MEVEPQQTTAGAGRVLSDRGCPFQSCADEMWGCNDSLYRARHGFHSLEMFS